MGGRPWTVYSWLQLFGFGLMIFGQLVYSTQVRLPGFYYPLDDAAADPEDPMQPEGSSPHSLKRETASDLSSVLQVKSQISQVTQARADSFVELLPEADQTKSRLNNATVRDRE